MDMKNKTKFFYALFVIITAISFFAISCSNNVSYIKNGKFIKPNIWDNPEIKISKLSDVQKKIYADLGKPSYILVYKEAVPGREKPRKIEEWVYEDTDKLLWFVEGNLKDDIPVQVPGLRKSIFARDEEDK